MVIVRQKRFCHRNSSLIWMWSNVDLEGRDISSTGQYGIILTSPIIIMGGHLASPRAISSGKYLLRLVYFYTTYHLCQVYVGTCVCASARAPLGPCQQCLGASFLRCVMQCLGTIMAGLMWRGVAKEACVKMPPPPSPCWWSCSLLFQKKIFCWYEAE